MQATVNNKQFRAAVSRLQSLPGAAAGIQSLSLAVITVDMEGVSITRSTPQARMVSKIDSAEVEDDGEAVVNVDNLARILGKMDAESLCLRSDGKHLQIEAGKRTAKLALAGEEFAPQTIEPSGDGLQEMFTLDAKAMCAQFGVALTCCSIQDADGIITGASLRSSDGGLEIIGTDRKKFFKLTVGNESDIDCAIPGPALASIGKAFGDLEGECEFAIYPNCMTVQHATVEATYALMEGAFPNIASMLTMIMGGETLIEIEVDRKELLDALGLANVFGDKDATICVNVLKNCLEVIGDNKSDAAATQTVDAKCKKYGEIKVNGNYLATVIDGMRDNIITMKVLQFNKCNQTLFMEESDRMGFVALIAK